MKFFVFMCLSTAALRAEFFYSPEMMAKQLETYSEKELQLIQKDLAVVRSVCLDGTQNTDIRFYLATAGGPGSRKTTILERFVATHPEYQEGVYLDADPRSLRFMVHTYYAQSLSPLMISQTNDYTQVIKKAYDKWRYGATYIGYALFEEAMALGRSIVFGTTSTGIHVPNLFAKLKENGYKIVLLLCSGSDQFRKEAVEYRNQVVRFYQSAPEDAVAKGKVFSQRMGTYFAYADLMYFYWNDTLFSRERLAAVWERGKLEVVDAEAMERFRETYEKDRDAFRVEGVMIPAFETYFSSTF